MQGYDHALRALAFVAGRHGIAADAQALRHNHPDTDLFASALCLAAPARALGLRLRSIVHPTEMRLADAPRPLILRCTGDVWLVLGHEIGQGQVHVFDPDTGRLSQRHLKTLAPDVHEMVLVARHWRGALGAWHRSMAWFTQVALRYRAILVDLALASSLIQLFALATPLMFQVIIDKVLQHRSLSTLTVICLGLLGLALFDVLMKTIRQYVAMHTALRVEAEIGSEVVGRLLSLPIDFFETRSTGSIVARIREIETIQTFLAGQTPLAFIDTLFILAFLAVLYTYSTPLFVVVCCSLPVYGLIAIVSRAASLPLLRARFAAWTGAQQVLTETLIGIATVKAAGIEPLLRHRFDEYLARYLSCSFVASRFTSLSGSLVEVVNRLCGVAILYVGANEVLESHLTVGGLVAFNMIATQMTQPVLRLAQTWQEIQQVLLALRTLGDVMEQAPEPQSAMGAGLLPAMAGRIDLRGVTFRYKPEGAPVLHNVSLSIAPGEVVGIVGASGSGKSTLIKLLQKFYAPQQGQVLIDGMDVAHLPAAWIRCQCGTVLQDNILFSRSVHDNIALSRPDMSREAVMACAEAAGAAAFIAALPEGYDTLIEERGLNLSGGQRQRLAIARALATEPKILIFDEATSALDCESELAIRASMMRIAQGRTVVIVAHRLSAVRHCHRIFAMEGGALAEAGTHTELMSRAGGIYAGLWHAQMQGLQ